MENILEIKNLNKKFKGFELKDISFSLPKGFIMGLVGENGAGKTSIIKAIMNLIKKDSGEIKVFGLDNIKNEKDIKQKIGFVYDESSFYEHLSIEDNKNLNSPFYKNWDDEEFYSYLNKFKLDKNQKIRELSKGMKMKFCIAFAFSHRAEFIILDEPTAGLDPVVRFEILSILREKIQDDNVGILISTHLTEDLEKIADFITFINDGKIIFCMSREEIFEKYKIVKGDLNLLNSQNEKLFEVINKNKYNFSALTSDIEIVKKYFDNDIVIEDATIESIMLLKAKARQEY